MFHISSIENFIIVISLNISTMKKPNHFRVEQQLQMEFSLTGELVERYLATEL